MASAEAGGVRVIEQHGVDQDLHRRKRGFTPRNDLAEPRAMQWSWQSAITSPHARLPAVNAVDGVVAGAGCEQLLDLSARQRPSARQRLAPHARQVGGALVGLGVHEPEPPRLTECAAERRHDLVDADARRGAGLGELDARMASVCWCRSAAQSRVSGVRSNIAAMTMSACAMVRRLPDARRARNEGGVLLGSALESRCPEGMMQWFRAGGTTVSFRDLSFS